MQISRPDRITHKRPSGLKSGKGKGQMSFSLAAVICYEGQE
jgi:hypothetical protein